MEHEGKLTPEERQRERDEAPARPLHPDAADPRAPEPHHALNNPAENPDPTEFPDPYERRADPRGPDSVDTPVTPVDEDDVLTPRPPSTSEPPPPRNFDEVKPEKGA